MTNHTNNTDIDNTDIEDFVHLIGDGWLTEAFDLKDGDKLLDLIERCEADVRKELNALIRRVEVGAYRVAILGICPSCKQEVKDWKPASGAFAPEWYASMREQHINPSTGHKNSCELTTKNGENDG